jgi:hypothetical protein
VRYLSEELHALRRTGADGREELCYRLGASVTELWAAVIEEEVFGTGYTKQALVRAGWRVSCVRVVQEAR